MKNLKDMNLNGDSLNDLGLNKNEKNGNVHSFELIEGGKVKEVINLDDYINKRIAFISFISSQIMFCEEIRNHFSQ